MTRWLMVGLCLCSAPAAADEAVAKASADSVAQFLAIAHYCPMQAPTNRQLAGKYADAFRDIGRQNTSAERWTKMLAGEGARRLREIQVTGDREWCENQRRFLEEAGAVGIMPR